MLGGKVRLLSDPELKVIREYKMEMPGGAMANMGYVVVDSRAEIVARQVDGLFGTRAGKITGLLTESQRQP